MVRGVSNGLLRSLPGTPGKVVHTGGLYPQWKDVDQLRQVGSSGCKNHPGGGNLACRKRRQTIRGLIAETKEGNKYAFSIADGRGGRIKRLRRKRRTGSTHLATCGTIRAVSIAGRRRRGGFAERTKGRLAGFVAGNDGAEATGFSWLSLSVLSNGPQY